LDTQAVGLVSEAPHFGDPYENKDGLKILHVGTSSLIL